MKGAGAAFLVGRSELTKNGAGASRPNLPILVDAVEMGRILSISRDAVYEAALAGKLGSGCYRIGNRWRFDPEAVLEAVAVYAAGSHQGMTSSSVGGS